MAFSLLILFTLTKNFLERRDNIFVSKVVEMKKMKKGLSVILALSMLVTLFVPMMVSAADNEGVIRLTDRINLGTTGNIESIEKEELTLNIPMENTQSVGVVVDWTFEIYDENERLVDDFYYSTSLYEGEARIDSVNFKKPELCGVYTIKAFSKTTYGSEVEYASYDKENFSVSYINEEGEGNKNLGINVHTIGGGQGETEDIADAVVAAGYGWIREANEQNLENSSADLSGEWTMPEAQVNDLAYYKDKGLDILMQIWGPRWKWTTKGHGGCIPQDDAEREIFRAWMTELATETSPYVSAYEVFNEPDSTMFPSGTTAEERAEKYLAALQVVDEVVADEKDVVATASAMQEASEFHNKLWELGAYDYLDIFSTHRYPYQGSEYMRYQLVDHGAEAERTRVKGYTTDGTVPFKEMWLTELGYATPDIYADGRYAGQSGNMGYTWHNTTGWTYLGYEDGIPRREQARGLTNAYFVNTITDEAFDKLFVLNIVDYNDPTYYQYCWGILNSFMEDVGGYTPLSAKPAFVATAAFNHFIDDSSVVKEVINGNVGNADEYWHAAWFDNANNEKFNNDVIIVQSDIEGRNGHTDRYVNLSTGASTVDVYDLYGNFLGTMANASGEYTIPMTHEAYYLVGEFTKLEGSAAESSITLADRYNKEVAPGSEVSFTVNGLASGDVVEVRGLDYEAVGGTVTVKVPNLVSGKAYGQVLVKDSDGNLKYVNVVELWLTAPGLQVKAHENVLGIKGYTSAAVGELSVAVTDEAGEYLALDQISALNSGVFDFDLNVPQIGGKTSNLKFYNGTTTLTQQIIPEFEAHYTCLDGNGEPISLTDLTLENLDEGETVTIKLNLGADEDSNIMLMGGIYSKSGALMQADASNAEIDGGELSIELTANNKDNIKSIRIFVWDNALRPIKNGTKIN